MFDLTRSIDLSRIDEDPYRFIKRALSLIALIAIVGLITRSFLIPESFGRYGDYRADHLEEMREQVPVHSDGKICADCHDENAATKSEGGHAKVPCETCHFQPYALLEDRPDGHPEKVTPPDPSRDACLICHQLQPARPADFPQVADAVLHITERWEIVKEQLPNEKIETAVCIHCHDPHAPLSFRNTG